MDIQGGIYKIQNTANGKRYIGSAVNLARRFRKHRAELRRGGHHSCKLQRAWNKYGNAAFVFVPMLICDPVDLIPHEQLALDGLRPEYNVAPTAGSALGRKHTPESKLKMSVSSKGKPKSAEHRASMSRTRKGRPVTLATREKLSAAVKKYAAVNPIVITAATRVKMATARIGRTLTSEHKANIGRAGKGKKRTPETRAKMSAAQVGNKKSVAKNRGPRSPEFCAAVSKGRAGQPWSIARRAAYERSQGVL